MKILHTLWLAIAVAASGIISVSAEVAISKIAATGDDAVDEAGDPTGELFDFFYSDPVINQAGSVVFRAELRNAGAVTPANDGCLWIYDDDGLRLLAREGDTAPGTAARWVYFWATPGFADSGEVVFRATLAIGNGSVATQDTNTGIWKGASADDLTLVAREGSDAPADSGGSSGSLFATFPNTPVIDDTTGTVAFRGTLRVLSGGSVATKMDNHGIWSDASGDLAQVARRSEVDGFFEAPDTDGRSFKTIRPPVLNPSAETAFLGMLQIDRSDPEDAITGRNRAGIWSGDADDADFLVLAPRASDIEASTQTAFSAFSDPGINSAGEIAFRGKVRNPGGNTGIWKGLPNAPALVALKGAAAGGAAGNFQAFQLPRISDSGDVVFRAKLRVDGTGVTRDNDTGIWTGNAAGTSLVVLENDVAPGADGEPLPGPSLDSVVRFWRFTDPVINQNGQVAFRAYVRSAPTGLPGKHIGIWAQQPNGRLVLVARRGDELDVNGSPKVIQSLHMVGGSGGSDGRPRSFIYNPAPEVAAGQLVFYAKFWDGTWGVFLATIDDRPEPI